MYQLKPSTFDVISANLDQRTTGLSKVRSSALMPNVTIKGGTNKQRAPVIKVYVRSSNFEVEPSRNICNSNTPVPSILVETGILLSLLPTVH